jgi:polygalacturonase
MTDFRKLVFVLYLTLLVSFSVCAQDTRAVHEPVFPPVCVTIRAPLASSVEGPSIAEDREVQNGESARESHQVEAAIAQCAPGHAVELALGPDLRRNAFLIDPLTFPPGISLIIDGGVTVYASRTPENYQINDTNSNPNGATCGTVSTPANITGVCQPVITFLGDTNNQNEANSGLYGYGVLDGQGQKKMFNSLNTTWWGLLVLKKQEGANSNDYNENSPLMVSAGGTGTTLANDVTLYKITVRNPPFHTIHWGGDGLTVWDVHVQAPWDESNTDGFDLHGSNATLRDTIVANGDDDIAFAVNGADTKNITVKNFSAYARDGITALGNGNGQYSIHDLLIDGVTITGDLPSVVTTTTESGTTGTVNGKSQAALIAAGVNGYQQALPNAVSYVHGLNVKYQTFSNQSAITFRNVCIQDVRTPLNIIADSAPSGTTKVEGIVFQNVHMLPPGPQFENYDYGNGTSDGPGTGRYVVNFNYPPPITNFEPGFTLSNVVFDDLSPGPGSSIGSIFAITNQITATRNVYPSILNDLDANDTENKNDIENNKYLARAPVSTPSLANGCDRETPFLHGELFASKGEMPASGDETNLTIFSIRAGSRVSLQAVVQPILSQTTHLLRGDTRQQNVIAVGSPALSNAVRFYDGWKFVGSASLSANGTLASLEIQHLSPGLHIFTAQYPKDAYYASLNFGLVVIYALPR